MNSGFKSSLGLIAKILVVLALPLLLFSYVDSQPIKVTKDNEDDEGTRSVAVVNEDLGYASKTEEVVLGQQITSILNDQEGYSWVVVNRSAAEQGFEQEDYDAILYVPSSFSENVMTFKDESPEKASVNYVIQPNLVAKERQRLHREMANAKSAINHEMSTIYWSYVSQEVDNIRVQFDKILEKEIAFQDAMYSFYTPSSETLANEIDRHKNRLEGIREQTNRVDEASKDNANSAQEAESSIAQFTEALDSYKESQVSQERLLSEFQNENKELVQDGIVAYNQALENHQAQIGEQIGEYKSPIYQDDRHDLISGEFADIDGSLNNAKKVFNKWNKGGGKNLESQIITVNTTFLNEYNSHLVLDSKDNVLNTIEKRLKDKKEEKLKNPEPYEGVESLAFDQMYGDVQSVRVAVEELEDIIGGTIDVPGEEENSGSDNEDAPGEEENPEGENEDIPEEEGENGSGGEEVAPEQESPSTTSILSVIDLDWDNVYRELSTLDGENGTIEKLENEFESERGNWDDYVTEWEEAYEELEEIKGQVSVPLVEYIVSLQEKILASDKLPEVLSEAAIQELVMAFPNESELEKKKVNHLSAYAGDLAIFTQQLSERANINRQLVRNLLKNEAMQEELVEMYSLDEKLTDMFDKLTDGEESTGQITKLADEFDQLVADTNTFLDEYDEKVNRELTNISSILDNMTDEANSIADQIREVNAESFDWEESPSVEYLDGQMVFQFQQGTASGLDNLSSLVASLGENQNNITSDTEELQATVGSVQAESDELNNRWSSNVANTEQVKGDVYDVLGNTIVDGQSNPYVYDYLSNPVTVEGQVDGKVLSETEDRMPPVVLFIIILLSGLLIGFLTQYYSSTSYLVQGGLFVLLTLAVGLIISIYGLNIYPLDDSQAIMWSAFTILLLMACANIVRAGLFVGPFVGWLASLAMIMFFTSPLLDIVVPEFSFTNPVSNVYMGLLFGSSSSYVLTMIGLVVVILIMSALIYTLQVMRGKAKAEELDEEQAS